MTDDETPTTALPTDEAAPTTALPTDETAPTTAPPTDDAVSAEQPFAPDSAPDPDRTGPRPPASDAVWSSSSLTPAPRQAPRRPRPFTLVWGLALLAVGSLLIAISLGMDIDLLTTGVVLLSGLGLALLVLAILPSRGPRRPGA